MRTESLAQLLLWQHRPDRKPLLIRGPRAVGKTALVHDLAQRTFSSLLTLDLVRQPELAHLLVHASRDFLSQIERHTGKAVVPGETLLFIDEVHIAPDVRDSLARISELYPKLHLIAAGTEIALETHEKDPATRPVEQLYLGPVSFDEFLTFIGETRMQAYLESLVPGESVPGDLHQKLSQLMRTYQIVGGMPEAIATWVETGSYGQVEAVKKKIIDAFTADLEAQGRKGEGMLIQNLIARIPAMVGEKLKYVKIDPQRRARDVTHGLNLLTFHRVAYKVRHSQAHMLPLGAECNDRNFKALFLDVGLAATLLGIGIKKPVLPACLNQQLVGQHLLYAPSSKLEPRLYHWARPKSNATARVDYVFSLGRHIVPVEVKPGKTGTLRGLHRFLAEKETAFGVRFHGEPLSLSQEQAALAEGGRLAYRLLSLPLYMVGQVHRLCRTLFLQEDG